jgi:hypothetical protein
MHRRNNIELLRATPVQYGVEVDIRSNGSQLVIHHDPYARGESFENWLTEYRHGILILNVKEEGLEARLIDLMRQYEVIDFFFLDQSFPFLVKWSLRGERRSAVRVSEFESVETALRLAGKIDWVWIDCFTHFALTQGEAQQLKQAGFNLCLVSPELQGRNAETEVPQLQQLLKDRKIDYDAVCTKYPSLWDRP